MVQKIDFFFFNLEFILVNKSFVYIMIKIIQNINDLTCKEKIITIIIKI